MSETFKGFAARPVPSPTHAVDVLRYPRVAEYLSRLPHGIDSYPDCQAKAILYRHCLDALPLRGVRPGSLPESLVALAEMPAPRTFWITDVRSIALRLAMLDHHHLNDLMAQAWVLERSTSLFSGPIMQLLMCVTTPGLLLQGAKMRWNHTHRGSELTVLESTSGHATVKLTFPPHLYDLRGCQAVAISFQAALKLSAGGSPRVVVAQRTPTEALFKATWF